LQISAKESGAFAYGSMSIRDDLKAIRPDRALLCGHQFASVQNFAQRANKLIEISVAVKRACRF
jgi:hypothetical protein